MTLTIEECEATGGHEPVRQTGGVIGMAALHRESCSRCPAIREGVKPFRPHDSEIAWSEWGKWGISLPPEESHG